MKVRDYHEDEAVRADPAAKDLVQPALLQEALEHHHQRPERRVPLEVLLDLRDVHRAVGHVEGDVDRDLQYKEIQKCFILEKRV